MEQYKLALVQMNCAFGEQEQNRKKAEQYIREAAKKGAALVCLPESFNGGYLGSRILDMKAMAEPLDGPSVSHMRRSGRHRSGFARHRKQRAWNRVPYSRTVSSVCL